MDETDRYVTEGMYDISLLIFVSAALYVSEQA